MEQDKTWYDRNRLQVRLIQYIIYHLKKEGYTLSKMTERPSRQQTKAQIIDKPVVVSFD